MECESCGLRPFDLPDGIDPDYIFEFCEHCNGLFCQPCLYEHEAIVEVAS